MSKFKPFKLLRTLSFILGLTILALFIYTIINFGFLQNQLEAGLKNQILQYGYISIFLISFLLEGLPQPFVSAIFPFITGVVLGLDFKLLLLITIAGAILSGFIAYAIGIIYGKKIAIKIAGEENYQTYHNLFKKYGKLGMTIIALTPLPYFPILAGVFKMNLGDFIRFAVLPRIIHFLVFAYIASFFI
ncbi:hypothetical protein HOE04_04900 [archaeon]|jgi:membrane protein YqaA with SNARE-associated domain|nr:hypothetical protein [archaeon]